MFNSKPLLTITLLTVSSVASAAEQALDAQQVAQLIEKADSYRLQDDSSKVVSLVRLYQDHELDKRVSTMCTRGQTVNRWWCSNRRSKRG